MGEGLSKGLVGQCVVRRVGEGLSIYGSVCEAPSPRVVLTTSWGDEWVRV
jgi:hypothetical protein